MPTYQYKARDRQGRLINAVIEADDIRTAARNLREKGLFIAEIKEPGKGLQAEIKLPGLDPKPGLKDLAIFSRQLATMLNAGLPIVQALAILERQTEKKKFQSILKEIRTEVEGGANFSEALSKHSLFTRLYINLVRAGETSGTLDAILDRLATFLENELALRGKIRSAMTYPAIVFVFAIGVTYFLLTGIVPQFAQILTGLGSELPLLTRALMGISDFLRQSTIFIALMAVALYFAYRAYYRTDKGRHQIDQIKLKLPVFGNLMKKSALARFSRTLATLLRSGVPLLQSIQTVERVAGNVLVARELAEVYRTIKEGGRMATVLGKSRFFPPMTTSMIAIGEESGMLDLLLEKMAVFYEQEVEALVARMSSLIEPLMILGVGAMVGFMALSIYLPLFGMAGAMQAGTVPGAAP